MAVKLTATMCDGGDCHDGSIGGDMMVVALTAMVCDGGDVIIIDGVGMT
jgi:hypothetical protein